MAYWAGFRDYPEESKASSLQAVMQVKSFGGVQGVYTHQSGVCSCNMMFAVYLPPQAQEQRCPIVWYLSGLTCTHQNVMEKGEYRRIASELGLIVVCPDTSPRGPDVPDEVGNWQFGSGAGFYVDATQAPYHKHYRMYSYLMDELPIVISQEFKADITRQSILGHSMGGHGALVMALRNPHRFRACSAFSPIAQPMTADWSRPAFSKYLGEDPASWRRYDATSLMEDGERYSEFLVDQGTHDNFLKSGLRPWLLEQACTKASIKLNLRMQEGYDHSYFFVSTFMEDHLRWHAQRLS